MPKLNKTKFDENWISQNHGKFNEMQVAMLWNAKIKKMLKIATEFWETFKYFKNF